MDSLWRYTYEESFLANVHLLLFLGHLRARGRIHCNCEEDEITGFLTEALEIEMDRPDFFGLYEVREQKPVHSPTRAGKRRQKIDLVLGGKDPRGKREFCCEAKRLKTSTNAIGKYTGDEGMGCFVNCEYAQDQPMGAMLGYVQSSTMSYWHGELVRSLATTEDLNIQSPLSAVQVIDQLSEEWFSVHQRVNGQPMTIYHIFLDCL